MGYVPSVPGFTPGPTTGRMKKFPCPFPKKYKISEGSSPLGPARSGNPSLSKSPATRLIGPGVLRVATCVNEPFPIPANE
jgi:hypothetical protein